MANVYGGRWSTQPGDLPPAVRDSLDRCPTCGTPWPEDVPAEELTACDDVATLSGRELR